MSEFRIGYSQPRLSEDELTALIRAELPGIDFQTRHEENTFTVVLEWRRRVEGYRAFVSDYLDMMDPEALPAITARAIDEYREKAMQDCGLRAILEREKAEVFKTGFQAMVKNLSSYVNDYMAEWVTVLDENGEEAHINAGPTAEGQRLLAWAKNLTGNPPTTQHDSTNHRARRSSFQPN